MPVQHTMCGRPLSCRLPPRRMLFVLGILILFAVSTLVFTIPSSIPNVPPAVAEFSESIPHHLPDHIPKPKMPSISIPEITNPFKQSAHKPPVQANSTSGQVSWHSHYKWLNPFSSSLTLDEERAVLPPVKKRLHIYTFYDTSEKRSKEKREAEEKLLLLWRRAWWAQGFRPVVLGRAEAVNNPLHESVQALKLDPALEAELARWLAWEQMGSGILANWLALPMGARDDPLISYLRRGTYPELTRYAGLGSGLFSGEHAAVTDALKQALASPKFKESKSLIEVLPEKAFRIDQSHQGIAFYDFASLKEKYSTISEKLAKPGAEGLTELAQLINSHLHTTFQNLYSKGIAVLKPLPDHATALVDPALQIAARLAECSDSPLPSSCPPNRARCTPCDSAHPLHISTPQIFRNQSDLYTIATVPHPFTLVSLTSQGAKIDRKYIRRQSARDPWIAAATRELMGPDLGASPRLIRFKEAVGSDENRIRSLWLTAEKAKVDDVDWHFGFSLPKPQPPPTTAGKKNPVDPKTAPGSTPPKSPPKSGHPESEGPLPTPAELKMEQSILEKASNAVLSSVRQQKSLREMVEAWNLADTEAWRFTRAYRAREQKERLAWEAEEKKFAGGGATGRGLGWGKWFDRGS